MVGPQPSDIMRGLVPTVQYDQSYIMLIVALVGTTISPYMQLYVQSSVVEKGVSMSDYRYTSAESY